MLSENVTENPLWFILVDTVHSLILYKHHKAFVRDSLLHEKPDISPRELATNLRISLGEAMVILHELGLGEDHADEE